jgi:CubicO group peptidase (beta-lactamase class C family)
MLLLQTARAQNSAAIDQAVEQQKNLFGGKLVAAVWKDTLIYQKATHEELTINSQAPVGCISAWFTAAVTMTFVEQGKISLDDPVSKYLPIFATYAKSYLTIRHCLANVTGIEPDKGGVQRFFQRTKFETLEDQVNAFAKREIKNNPGEVFFYNEIGTDIVARVLELVGKKSFDRLAAERIFRPCGMKRSTFASDRAINPFSGALSTSTDMIRFLQMLLNKGMAGTKKVLAPESIAEMHKIQTGNAQVVFVPAQAQGYQYGLGCWIGGYGDVMNPGISGGWAMIDAGKNLAVVIIGEMKGKEDKKDPYLKIIAAVN